VYYRRRQGGCFPIVETLKAVRSERGIPRKVLAAKVGCGHYTLIKWENGHCVPSLQALYDWCEALDLDLLVERDDV
jgi:transcriptional regulator with XRE-family HTH domain